MLLESAAPVHTDTDRVQNKIRPNVLDIKKSLLKVFRVDGLNFHNI